MNFQKHIVAGFLLTLILSRPAGAAPSFQQAGSTLVMSNANVRLEYNLNAGTTDFYWKNSKKISAFYSAVTLSTGYVKGVNYGSWSYAVSGGNQVIVTATGSGLPVMKQYFTLDQDDSFLIRVDVLGSNLKANWMGPVVMDTTAGVDLGVANDNRALVVPFDNDGFVRYNAMPMNSSGTSYEVSAFYDNTTRNGLVVGSVTHDTWKTGILFAGANNKLNAMNVYGGATTPADVAPHGSVSGNTISSPTMFVGFGADWRATMQNYAAENVNFAPRLAWTNGVPFGWNSWGVLQQNISYTAAIAVSDYFYVNLMSHNFSNHGTVYINLDAFWNDNLSPAQLQSFADHCHAHGEKAGIYWGPFVFFGSLTNATNWTVTGATNYHYSDLLLRDGNGNPESADGGYAVDPTHPGTRQTIDYYVNLFTNWGFDYVKLDFLSHGAFEGVHYDTNVTTGIQAYNQGMQHVLNQINGRMFISESIAPLFPYQYAHSRRIACDAQTSRINDTEYTMNSVSYGWWLDNLYQFNDPDIMVFANGANTNEAQSRLISGTVTGVFLNGDDLSTTNGQNGAISYLTNSAIDAVARVGQTFMPVEGNTGSSAVSTFVRQDGATWYVAVFNYSASSASRTIDLSRAGLPPGTYFLTNLWDGTTSTVTGSFNVSLNARQSKLFGLALPAPASLQWKASGNSGVWDTGSSANWINLSNSQQVVFNANNQVLFDDTVGVPTNVSVSGTVSPSVITVNSSTNNFLINGSGTLTGAGSLIKNGASTLTLNVPVNSFTGPVAINGGTVVAGNFAFANAASITITNNSTLDFNGSTMNNNTPVTVSGAGEGGVGAIVNSVFELYGQVLNITLAGDTTFGGGTRWDLGSGSAVSGPFKVTMKRSDNTVYGEWDTVNLATNVGDLELSVGKWGIKGMGNSFGNPSGNFIVDSGTELDFWNSSFGPASGYNKNIHVLSNGKMQILTSPNTFFNANVTLEDSSQLVCFYGSGSQMMNGTYALNGIVHLLVRDSTVMFTNIISGPGGFVWDAYNNQIVFTASNTYSGPTVIGGGLTLALTGNGSISQSSPIFFGGSTTTNVSLDVSGRPDQTLTLASGQTLGGIGTINGSLVVAAGATISPAGTNTTIGITAGTNASGTISATNAIVLSGTTTFKLNGSGVNDVVQAGAGITYGGTLNLVNISGAPYAVGNSFQIFSAASYNGTFANITPATPGAGLAWDTSQLNIGFLNVATAPSQPVVNNVLVSGGNLIFNGTNGVANGSYVVLVSTNVAAPLADWIPLATNTFDANGAFSVTNSILPGTPQQFYCLQLR
jgi:alpha-galactosidase